MATSILMIMKVQNIIVWSVKMKYKIKSVLALILLIIFFTGCDSKQTRPMLISTNLWVGYSPLYYAQEKGWLRENNIKLIRTVSLAESLNTFQNRTSDVLCGTRYEIQKVSQNESKPGSVILLDRSNGGDYILSNRSLDELKRASKIDVFMEIESVNSILLEFFMNMHGLKSSQMNLINSSQIINSKLPMKKNATLIITYEPYNIKLEKQGYRILGSTKEPDLLVIDAMYIPHRTKQKFTKEIDRVNFIMFQSLKALKENPKEYFQTINKYYEYANFTEFENSLNSIEWIYSNHSLVIKNRKESSTKNFPKLIKPYQE